MRFAGLDPMEQVAHQFWYTVCWWSHVQAVAITIKHSDTLLSVVSSIPHQLAHHQSVSLQQIFLFESIQLRHQTVSLDSILHLLDLVWSAQHMFAVEDVCHLLQRKRVVFDGKRRVNGSNLVFLSQHGRRYVATYA